MAAPTYATDLVDLNLAEATTDWTEPTGATGGGVPTQETDYFIQGAACISKTFNVTGLGGLGWNRTAGAVTINSPACVFAWIYCGAPNTLATEASGGMRIIVGNTLANYKAFYVRGSDTYTYGGWVCVPVDPSLTADATQGTPSGTWQYFGSVWNTTAAIGKGNPMAVDALRYGRELRVTNGDLANGYATFTGAASQNDISSNRWGLCQAIDGGFLIQGLFVLGLAATSVDFRDSNKSVLIANTKKVASTFNAFEVRNASSRVDWTNIAITALGTVSRGNFITTDNADINIDTCTFTDMGTFGFQSNSTILTSTFRRCNLITQNSAVFTSCTFDTTNDSVKAMLVNNPTNISSCRFISSGTKHAIEINTAGTYTFSGNTFTGYASSNGSTGNEAIYNNSGGAVTLNITNGGSTPSVRNGAGASTTIVTSVPVSVHVEDGSGADIANAQVFIRKTTSYYSYTSHNTNNAAGDATFEVNEVIDTDLPQGGWLHVWDASANTKQNYRYISWSGTSFSLRSQVTGSATSAGSSTTLNATNISSLDIQEGDTIQNTTDGSWAVVDEIVDANQITTTALQDGTDNTWQSGDSFSLHRLAIAYESTDLVDIPLFNGQTDTNGDISTTFGGSTPVAITIRVRKSEGASKYIPFSTSGTITGSGYSLTAVLTEDTVAI